MYNTTTTYSYSAQANAEAFITKGKDRLKQNGSEVYLNDNDNFEIELFNPRTNPVLVKIKINGKLISSTGLVLQPGQRYHLDRHIDEAAKFVFNTYEVESSKEALKAISDNGSVIIEFYDEVQVVSFPFNGYHSGIQYFNTQTPSPYCSNASNTVSGTYPVSFTSNTTSGSGINAYYSCINSILRGADMNPEVTLDSFSPKIETGRVGKGDESNQKFGKSNLKFNGFPINTVKWLIKPASLQPVEVKDLLIFCGGCGKKKTKKQDSFCSSCGNKF